MGIGESGLLLTLLDGRPPGIHGRAERSAPCPRRGGRTSSQPCTSSWRGCGR